MSDVISLRYLTDSSTPRFLSYETGFWGIHDCCDMNQIAGETSLKDLVRVRVLRPKLLMISMIAMVNCERR
jgi:hypothetical protein